MRRRLAYGFVLIATALSGCASKGPPGPALPLTVANGIGAQHGTYGAQTDGEMRGPDGERCVLFNWDRPLDKDYALRLRSASCESAEHPGWMVCSEISRTVIPIAASTLATGSDASDGPGDAQP